MNEIFVGFLICSCRYTRVKQDNAALTARIHMLEEHIREIEVLYSKSSFTFSFPFLTNGFAGEGGGEGGGGAEEEQGADAEGGEGEAA